MLSTTSLDSGVWDDLTLCVAGVPLLCKLILIPEDDLALVMVDTDDDGCMACKLNGIEWSDECAFGWVLWEFPPDGLEFERFRVLIVCDALLNRA